MPTGGAYDTDHETSGTYRLRVEGRTNAGVLECLAYRSDTCISSCAGPGASMATDGRRRDNLGVAACAVELEGSRVRPCFVDVKSNSPQWPHQWQAEALHTWLECDAADCAKTRFPERQLADIGLTLLARLAVLAKS